MNAQDQGTINPPAAMSETEKAQWIREHPDEYKRLAGIQQEPAKATAAAATDTIATAQTVEIPQQPVFTETGNPEQDRLNYEKAMAEWKEKMRAINEYNKVFMQDKKEKEAWIESNPELYNPN